MTFTLGDKTAPEPHGAQYQTASTQSSSGHTPGHPHRAADIPGELEGPVHKSKILNDLDPRVKEHPGSATTGGHHSIPKIGENKEHNHDKHATTGHHHEVGSGHGHGHGHEGQQLAQGGQTTTGGQGMMLGGQTAAGTHLVSQDGQPLTGAQHLGQGGQATTGAQQFAQSGQAVSGAQHVVQDGHAATRTYQ